MSGVLLILLLAAAVLFVVLGTARWKMHPFLVLLVASYGIGLLSGLPAPAVVEAIVAGFGATIGYIGIVIAAGTIIGIVLERSGGAAVLARTVVGWIGRARSALAMSLTGAVVSVPVFCDSGFVVLSPLARSLARQAGTSAAVHAVALSMGLYATHVFIPPTPGPIAAAGELGADIGMVIILGVCVTIPVIATTYLFARTVGSRIYVDPGFIEAGASDAEGNGFSEPAAWKAFAPIVLPVLLIALQSVSALPSRPFGTGTHTGLLEFLGNPNTALLLGAFLAFWTVRERGTTVWGEWAGKGLREAGVIILITGAGGAFGRVLQATPLGDYLGEAVATLGLDAAGVLIPFLVAAALKTALGSSTVAIITTASIVLPMLPELGMAAGLGPALATLAIGAGAMTVSHANDSYFWVVSQFSGMDVEQAYRLQTVGSAVAGVTGIAAVLLLSVVLL